MIMPVTSMMPMLLRAPAPGPRANTSGMWPMTVAAVVIRIGRSRVCGGLDRRPRACPGPVSWSLLANSTIRMPFFAIEADERDQADLAVDVERREAEEREEQRARERQRHRAREDDERVAEALELGREHEVDQDRRQQEREEELAALGPQLPRLAGVVDREALGQDRRPPRSRGHFRALSSETPGGMTPWMRTAFSCWKRFRSRGCGRRLEGRERRERHELAAGAGHVDVCELVGREALGALDLRDDLVAAALDAEAIDVVAAEHRREVAAGLPRGSRPARAACRGRRRPRPAAGRT